MRLNNVLHPLQVAKRAKAAFATHLHIWKFGNHGRQRFQNDPRYHLRYVTRGFASPAFASPANPPCDDTRLLERICSAYNAAVARQQAAPQAYATVQNLDRLRQGPLGPSIRALRENDTTALAAMYRNFYRDPCSAGLLAAPGGISRAYFGGQIKDIYRRFYLTHVLYRLDYWKEITGGRFSLKDLAGPGIGNPFGVTIDGTHIGVGAEYAHYCAYRAADLLERAAPQRTVIAEIGGGFGAVAYYLLRDNQPLTYINFDIPERVALSSYYLMKAFPHLTFVLYGEKPLLSEMIRQADVVLLPAFALADMPSASVDITFSSNGLVNFSPHVFGEALRSMAAMTKRSLLYIGNERFAELIALHLGNKPGSFTLADSRASGWHSHKVSGAGVGGAAARASSTLLEQTFHRNPASTPIACGSQNCLGRSGDAQC